MQKELVNSHPNSAQDDLVGLLLGIDQQERLKREGNHKIVPPQVLLIEGVMEEAFSPEPWDQAERWREVECVAWEGQARQGVLKVKE